ncbi:hypothetical protein [Cerasicoccus fimbriatus]|uniref:hypothetical protein n=1 Tax=Cerasicoccus fimbriatus TaxID=3014554 RepID=UPI0022B37AB8|nr:hypothetical protein [Cerasicoccus sp. TK19100]
MREHRHKLLGRCQPTYRTEQKTERKRNLEIPSQSFFALGEDAGGCSEAIDLVDPDFGVFWFDRQHIEVLETDRSEERMEAWIARQIKDHTHDLMADGIDPNGTPKQRDEEYEKSSKSRCYALSFSNPVYHSHLTNWSLDWHEQIKGITISFLQALHAARALRS